MGRESSMQPNYNILSYLTMNQDRVIDGGNTLCLLAENEEELKKMTVDIAKAMKADVVQLKNDDYIVIRI